MRSGNWAASGLGPRATNQSPGAESSACFGSGLPVVVVVAGLMAAFATREASSRCRWASRNAAEMSRVCSVIDWRSRQRDRSDSLPGVGRWI